MSMYVSFIRPALSLDLFLLLPSVFLSLFWPTTLFFSGFLVAFWSCYPDVIILTATFKSVSFPIIWKNLVILCALSELPRPKLPNQSMDIFIARCWIDLPFTSVHKKPGQMTQWLFQTDRQRLEPNLAHSTELRSLNWSRHKSKSGIMYLQSGLQRYF